MYLEYWGLKQKPFENTPDPRFLYPSREHREGLQKLLYSVSDKKGCALLTGEYGCGKTILLRTIVANLNADRYELALINYPIFTNIEFFKEILYQFGKEKTSDSRLELFRELSNLLFTSVQQGKWNLIIIDEGQLIEDPAVFEELRLLLNLQMEDQFLMTILLVGQPELRERIMEYPQLDQRIAVKVHLHRFDHEDTVRYVEHRLRVAGSEAKIFAPETLYLIYKISYGVPRRINNLCDLCLLEGYNRQSKTVDAEILKHII